MIGHLARDELARRAGEQLRHVGVQVFVRKASNQKTEHQQHAAQRDHGRIAKLQPAGC